MKRCIIQTTANHRKPPTTAQALTIGMFDWDVDACEMESADFAADSMLTKAFEIGLAPAVETVDQEGALHFASAADSFTAVDAVSDTSEDSLDAWETKPRLLSMRRTIDKPLHAIEGMTETESHAMFHFCEDPVEILLDELHSCIAAGGELALTNPSSVFYVGSVVYKMLPEFVISSDDGKLDTIDAVRADPDSAVITLAPAPAVPTEV